MTIYIFGGEILACKPILKQKYFFIQWVTCVALGELIILDLDCYFKEG